MNALNSNESDLFRLLTDCKWDEVLFQIDRDPSGASELMDTGKRGAARISALQTCLAHPKCRGDVPLEVIKRLLETAPQMANKRHLYTGNYPLHAVFYNAFFSSSKRNSIARMIIDTCPESVIQINNDGRNPLHTNCTQHCNYEPILTLLNSEQGKQAACTQDKKGNLPLHLACMSHKPPNKSIQALFDAYPEGICVKNKDGLTPLEVAKACPIKEQRKTARIKLLQQLENNVVSGNAQSKSRYHNRDIEKNRHKKRPQMQERYQSPEHQQEQFQYLNHNDAFSVRSPSSVMDLNGPSFNSVTGPQVQKSSSRIFFGPQSSRSSSYSSSPKGKLFKRKREDMINNFMHNGVGEQTSYDNHVYPHMTKRPQHYHPYPMPPPIPVASVPPHVFHLDNHFVNSNHCYSSKGMVTSTTPFHFVNRNLQKNHEETCARTLISLKDTVQPGSDCQATVELSAFQR